MRSIRVLRISLVALLLLGLMPLYASSARAQIAPPPPPAYGQAELDRLLAPIALYPDALLSQILMAATYPLEVAEAANWSRRFPGLSGDAAVRAVQDRDWDPSVKSLVAFPNVLQRMGDNPEWTRSLGSAFLEQEPYVMETIQQLRQRARAAGTLSSDERQRVIEDGGRLRIEPVRTEIVYVPYYDPWLAYGAWRWPSHPPVAWAPWPGYAVARPGLFVAWGPAIRLSLGFFFGGFDWQHQHVNVVHVNNYYINRPAVVYKPGRSPVQPMHPGRWRHDAKHRHGLAYADPALVRSPAGPAHLTPPAQITPAPAAAPPPVVSAPLPVAAAPVAIKPVPPPVSAATKTAQFAAKAPHPYYPRAAGSYTAEPAPRNGYPSPARQLQLEQGKERREQARKTNEPSPAQRQQTKQDKGRRGEPEYRQEPRKHRPKPE